MARCQPKSMTVFQAQIVMKIAKCNMKVAEAAREFHCHRNTMVYHIEQIKRFTHLDARNFYDLQKLVIMATDILQEDAIKKMEANNE